MRTLLHLFYNRYYDLEVFTSVVAVFYGIWLVIPLWDSFSSLSYQAMARLAPEELWGSLICLIGASQLVLMYRHSFHDKENSRARSYISAMATSVWFFVATMFIVSNIATTGVPVYSLIAAASCLNTIRLAQHSYGKL